MRSMVEGAFEARGGLSVCHAARNWRPLANRRRGVQARRCSTQIRVKRRRGGIVIDDAGLLGQAVDPAGPSLRCAARGGRHRWPRPVEILTTHRVVIALANDEVVLDDAAERSEPDLDGFGRLVGAGDVEISRRFSSIASRSANRPGPSGRGGRSCFRARDRRSPRCRSLSISGLRRTTLRSSRVIAAMWFIARPRG